MPPAHCVRDPLSSKSTIYTKLPRDLRRQVDQAVIDRDPPTYKAIFDKFALADYGVSFTGFYMYARRLRYHASLLEQAVGQAPSEEVIANMAIKLLGNHLLLVMMDDAVKSRVVQRVADAWRGAVWAKINQSPVFASPAVPVGPEKPAPAPAVEEGDQAA